MCFDRCIQLCNHCHKQDMEHFHHPLNFPQAPLQSIPNPILRLENHWSDVSLYFAFSKNTLLMSLVFPFPVSLDTVVKNDLIIYVRIISGFSFLFYWPIYLSICQYNTALITHCSFVVSFEIRKCDTSSFVFQNCFGYLRPPEILHEY